MASGNTNTSEWLHQFHHNNTSSSPSPASTTTSTSPDTLYWQPSQSPEATVISTSAITSTTTAATITPTSSPPTHLGAEGRVTKQSRRRTRASRRTPTTLLSTDPTNFRAMVQQFTGGPSTAFTSLPSHGGFGIIGAAGMQQARNTMVPSYGLQLPLGQAHQYGLTTTTLSQENNTSNPSSNLHGVHIGDHNSYMVNNNNNNAAFLGGTRGSSTLNENRSTSNHGNANVNPGYQF